MKKRCRIILSIVLPIICIASVCMSFFMPKTKADENVNNVVQQITAEDTRASSAGKDQKGGAVYIENGTTYVMRGGTISGMVKKYGGAIYVADGATFTMEAGTIAGCQAKYGGAIYIASGGTCNINGGSITGNKAENAPAIYVESGATLNISNDAVIENNVYELYFISISMDTIAVGDPSAGFNMYYVDFGNFPQWYVGNDMNIVLEDWYNTSNPAAVNKYTTIYNWLGYEYTDGNIYVRGMGYVWYDDWTYASGENVVANGSVSWFKVEPIRWIILNYDTYTAGIDSRLEVMSYFAVAAGIRFYPNKTDDGCNEWVNSELRSWLNSTFYNSAFTKEEQKIITRTTVENNVTNNYSLNTSNGSGITTYDDIYVLSYWDYCNPNGLFANSSQRRLCSATDFAVSNNCYKSYAYETVLGSNGGTCYYWTRSAGLANSYICRVYYDGTLGAENDITLATRGIRPVLKLAA